MIPLAAPPLRRHAADPPWIGFRTGFGQSVISVLAVVLVLVGAAALHLSSTPPRDRTAARFPASAFAAYAAGIGVLLAQALLVRRIERDPVLRPAIESAANPSPSPRRSGAEAGRTSVPRQRWWRSDPGLSRLCGCRAATVSSPRGRRRSA